MNWTGTIIIVLMFVFVGLMAVVRLSPSNPAEWHVDPTDLALKPGDGRALMRADGDLASPEFDMAPQELLAAFDAVADASPRTRVIAGSVEEGRITYMTRSLIWGFPDYTSVTAIPSGDGAKLVAYARLRFGSSDLGVNAKRLQSWVDAVAAGS
ncbi:DUF1499 domain-containing protein [Tropicimonas sp. S265A]|uniref:DUF1499 domain-containing protein n=1 Tax=Tropicimonas sp. S265A TaxID=3415134 RepID=UPI003C7B681E